MIQKIKGWFVRFFTALRKSLPLTLVMTGLWLVLGWLYSFGVHSALLFPLNFLTGALAGLDGGTLIGGTVGKAILLLLVNSFLRTLLTAKGGLLSRLWGALKTFVRALLRLIPHFTSLRQLFTGDRWRVAANGIGFGMALIGYALLTGNGSLQNSFVCFLLFSASGSALVSQRGLLITPANRLLRLLGLRNVDRDLCNRLVGGNQLGNAAALFWAGFVGKALPMGLLGAALMLLSAIFLILHFYRARKEGSV
jgi:hypothetical protein